MNSSTEFNHGNFPRGGIRYPAAVASPPLSRTGRQCIPLSRDCQLFCAKSKKVGDPVNPRGLRPAGSSRWSTHWPAILGSNRVFPRPTGLVPVGRSLAGYNAGPVSDSFQSRANADARASLYGGELPHRLSTPLVARALCQAALAGKGGLVAAATASGRSGWSSSP